VICRDFARSRNLVTQLLSELEFSQHIQVLVAIANFDAVSERISETVMQILDSPAGTLLLHDPRIERFVVAFTNDPDYHDDGDFVPGVAGELLEEALAAGVGFAESAAGERPVMLIPVQAGQDLIGVLRLSGRRMEGFEEDRARKAVRYIESVTAILGNLYQLSRSNELAMRDDLTKAYNRRFFESYLDEEIERSRRYGTFFSIIFLDLDDLKRVNNLYGHLAGSRTLQEVAKRVLTAVRAVDKVVRFGGDEFCIILPQTDQEQARSVASRVRRSVVESPFRIEPDVQVEITASFGIATFPVHASTKEDLIRQADAAMFRVKSTTKDSVGMAEVDRPTRRQA
jgi:diguanylate cyclase (GGDEF)-like protein